MYYSKMKYALACSDSHHNRVKCSKIIHILVNHLIFYRVKCSNMMYSLVDLEYYIATTSEHQSFISHIY